MVDVNVFVAEAAAGVHEALASWIVEATRQIGRSAALVRDRLPDGDGSTELVIAPDEYFARRAEPVRNVQRAAASCVAICTAEPGTAAFDLTVDAVRRAPTAYHVDQSAVRSLRDCGIDAHHLQLGAVPSMTTATASSPGRDLPGRDIPGRDIPGRDVEVACFGRLDPRRGRVLAELAGMLYRRQVELRVTEAEPPATAAGCHRVVDAFGPPIYELLSRCKTLLDLRRGAGPAGWVAWPRLIAAMANRCVVVTDSLADVEESSALVAGVHYVALSAADPMAGLEAILADESTRLRIADAAFGAVTDQLALHHAVAALLARIENLAGAGAAQRRSRVDRWGFGTADAADSGGAAAAARLAPFTPHRTFQRAAKRVAMAENDAQRRLDAAQCLLRHGAAQHVETVQTPSFADATPEVSVIVSLYNYAGVVADTLESVAASDGVEFEVIVVDDHSTDDGRGVAREVLAAHPATPMLLHAKDVNEGLAAARNSAFELARAELVMVLDADNQLYPTCLRKLADALHRQPAADGAYAILEDFGVHRGLRSAFEWDVPRLCAANYIDAQAMIRRRAWSRLGGYRADEEAVYGWEDWDLWLRLAAEGGHAVLVPEILGRYRVQPGSMIALTNLAADDAAAALHVRYPDLPWPPGHRSAAVGARIRPRTPAPPEQ